MKKTAHIFPRILSYIIVFLAGGTLVLYLIGNVSYGNSKLDQIEAIIDTYFIEDADLDAVEDAAADAMISSLGDRWSYYLNAEEYAAYKETVENAYVGIGITIQANTDGQGFLVIKVDESGGAYAAGIQAGDIVIGAEGQSVLELTTTELSSIIRGEAGTQVTVEVKRGEETLSFQITRAKIQTQVATYEMLDGNIGLIAISNFDEHCADDTIAAIEALQEQGAVALIFDVRNNPGGYASELVEVLDYILPEGVLFRSVDYAGNESIDESDASYLDMPIAVVCNQDSYSAGEFFPAAIQEYGAGTIVGTATCGKGYFQYVYELSDGSAIGLSSGKYFTPSGKSLIGTGVTPDIVVEVDDETNAAIAAGTLDPADDPQIQAAVEVLTSGDAE